MFCLVSVFVERPSLLAQVCISVAGSSVFVVLYSSVTIFAALIKRFYLGKQFSNMQWSGLGLIVCGLALSEIKDFGNGKSIGETLIGIFCGLGSAGFYAMYYVAGVTPPHCPLHSASRTMHSPLAHRTLPGI